MILMAVIDLHNAKKKWLGRQELKASRYAWRDSFGLLG
jgi:hypothetical protein